MDTDQIAREVVYSVSLLTARLLTLSAPGVGGRWLLVQAAVGLCLTTELLGNA